MRVVVLFPGGIWLSWGLLLVGCWSAVFRCRICQRYSCCPTEFMTIWGLRIGGKTETRLSRMRCRCQILGLFLLSQRGPGTRFFVFWVVVIIPNDCLGASTSLASTTSSTVSSASSTLSTSSTSTTVAVSFFGVKRYAVVESWIHYPRELFRFAPLMNEDVVYLDNIFWEYINVALFVLDFKIL